MAYCPPPERRRSSSPANHSSGSPRLETQEAQKPKRKRGSRGTSVSAKIQRTARERQDAWLDGEPHRNLVYGLTVELNGGDGNPGLYGQHRRDQAGTLTDPYYGRISKPEVQLRGRGS